MTTRAQQTLEQRFAAGRDLRKQVKRQSHSAIGKVDRDPVKLLETSSLGRVPRLVPLRYGRMLTSPFAFYRGSAIIQAHDLASTPHTGLFHQICGDCHLMNFGGFATPERNLVFDINDFDETHPGPWEWDLKRLAASLTLAARHLGFLALASDEVVLQAVQSYQTHMRSYAEMGALELWYKNITMESLVAETTDMASRQLLAKSIAKAQRRTQGSLLPKMSDKLDGKWVMRDSPPGLFHIHGGSTLFADNDDWAQLGHWGALSEKLFKDYMTSLSPSHRHLLDQFSIQDLAFKVVGVGSVGTRCLVLLMTDAQDQPLFLQIKEAMRSVLAPYVPTGKSTLKHQGERVVVGQRLMQASSDLFLGTSTGPSGRHFYFRQLRDMKISAEIESFDLNLLRRYAGLCGHVLARAHARAGGLAPQISGYLGKDDSFANALAAYARDYADQAHSDFESFRAACRTGRLIAQTESDFGADISV
jgi:uncharacterized protein (DUF2252 family)